MVGADDLEMCCTWGLGLDVEVWTVERDGVKAVEMGMVEGI